MVSGLFSGLAGAYVSLGLLSFFTENMVAGRGFIALAAVIFGKYNPVGALGASLLFGAAKLCNIACKLQELFPSISLNGSVYINHLALCGFVGNRKLSC